MSSGASNCPLWGHFSSVHSSGWHSLPSGGWTKKSVFRICWAGSSEAPGSQNVVLCGHVHWPHDSLPCASLHLAQCEHLGQVQPWPIQTLSSGRLMPVGGGKVLGRGSFLREGSMCAKPAREGRFTAGGEVGKERSKGLGTCHSGSECLRIVTTVHKGCGVGEGQLHPSDQDETLQPIPGQLCIGQKSLYPSTHHATLVISAHFPVPIGEIWLLQAFRRNSAP